MCQAAATSLRRAHLSATLGHHPTAQGLAEASVPRAEEPQRAPCAENETPQLGPRLQLPSLAPLSSPSGAPAASRCSAPRPGTAAETSASPAVPPHGRGKSGGLRADGSRPARLQPLPRLGRRRPQPGGCPGPPGGTRCGRGGAGRRRGRGRSAGPGRARDWRRERDATSGGGSPASLRSLPGASPEPPRRPARRAGGAVPPHARSGPERRSPAAGAAPQPARHGPARLCSALLGSIAAGLPGDAAALRTKAVSAVTLRALRARRGSGPAGLGSAPPGPQRSARAELPAAGLPLGQPSRRAARGRGRAPPAPAAGPWLCPSHGRWRGQRRRMRFFPWGFWLLCVASAPARGDSGSKARSCAEVRQLYGAKGFSLSGVPQAEISGECGGEAPPEHPAPWARGWARGAFFIVSFLLRARAKRVWASGGRNRDNETVTGFGLRAGKCSQLTGERRIVWAFFNLFLEGKQTRKRRVAVVKNEMGVK